MKKITGILAVLLLFAAGVSTQAQIQILQDSFSLASGIRAAGDSLDGKTVEQYNAGSFSTPPIWLSSTRSRFSATGTIIPSAANVGSMQGVVSVSNLASSTLTLKLDITVGAADWVGVQFLSSAAPYVTGNGEYNWFYNGNELFAMITNTGSVQLFRNGTATNLGAWNLSGFSASSAYTLQLQYNRDLQTASISVNGSSVASNIAIGTLNDPTIGYVGFRGQGASLLGSSVDNFSYLTSVPEPNSLALLTLSMATLCFVVRRKSCRA